VAQVLRVALVDVGRLSVTISAFLARLFQQVLARVA
jgi:hypothetical protein